MAAQRYVLKMSVDTFNIGSYKGASKPLYDVWKTCARTSVYEDKQRRGFVLLQTTNGGKLVNTGLCPPFQAYVHYLYVVPEARLQGVQKSLIEAAVGNQRAVGCPKESSMPFWESIGWRKADKDSVFFTNT